VYFVLHRVARRAFRAVLAATLLAAAAAGSAGLAQARGPLPGAAQASVALADLPREGQRAYALILRGGPFAHDKDGVVFGNRERLLPRKRRGYYREYTVETPGAQGRGGRRIVCGGLRPRAPDACWYSSDHYSSFRKIAP
jgi:ribonuclease T1